MSGRPLRLFVAIYPPEDSRGAMIDALRSLPLRPEARYRLTPVPQVHMTVQFIGETAPGELDETIESVQRSASGLESFALTPQRLITLPERGPVRLIAMETDAPAALMEIHRRLALRLARSPRTRANDRFRPHLTLCRFTGEARADRIDAPVRLPPFEVRSVMLVRSILRPEGAEHAPIAEVPLKVVT